MDDCCGAEHVQKLQKLMASKLLDAYSFSVVQTAYANGASSDYLKSMGIPVLKMTN